MTPREADPLQLPDGWIVEPCTMENHRHRRLPRVSDRLLGLLLVALSAALVAGLLGLVVGFAWGRLS